MHAPFPNQRVFLLFANFIGDFKRDHTRGFAGVRLVIQPLDSFLPPTFQRRVHRLFAHCQILGNGGHRPAFSVELHNIVTALRWIRSIVKGRVAAHLDRWRWARSQHGLDRMMRGSSLKTSIADFCNFTDSHVWHFHTQVNDQPAHIWRQAPRRFLWLLSMRHFLHKTGRSCLIDS